MENFPNPELRREKLREYFSIKPNICQKFIVAEDKQSKEKYLYTSPAKLHIHLTNELLEKGEKFYARGGGMITRDGDTYTFSGKSAQLGDFSKKDIYSIKQMLFPDLDFQYETEN